MNAPSTFWPTELRVDPARSMLSVVGCHAEGEVGDVVIGGFLAPPAASMFERMQIMERDHDHLRRLLICEPRGNVGEIYGFGPWRIARTLIDARQRQLAHQRPEMKISSV